MHGFEYHFGFGYLTSLLLRSSFSISELGIGMGGHLSSISYGEAANEMNIFTDF